MRLRINSLDLVGAERRVSFDAGLNIIAGPISSGKTTLLRLCRALLAGPIESFPREAREHITALNGSILIGDSEYRISRPFVTTNTAKVDIAGDSETQRLPALQRDATSENTYSTWLLEKLGLPRLDVPTAPTRPDSPSTPVSINDYFLYCTLAQDQIDSSVFWHNDTFRNIKRRYAFQILYGIYNLEVARLQDEYREVQARLRRVGADKEAIDRLLDSTPLENRAELERELGLAMRQLNELEEAAVSLAAPVQADPQAQSLRVGIRHQEERVSELRTDAQKNAASIDQLRGLVAQLETQSERLTRSIVADTYLLDFEFVICPRCGSDVHPGRESSNVCRLCLQSPKGNITREDLIKEQDAVGSQILETRELIMTHEQRMELLQKEIQEVSDERQVLAHQLNVHTESYVSDSADQIAVVAQRKAGTEARIAQLRDYIKLVDKLDGMTSDMSRLEERKRELEAALESATTWPDESESRIRHLEAEFGAILKEFQIPEFIDLSRTTINRTTYLPVLDGRGFNELSSQGLKVLVNVAHALAHHRASINLNLALPSILFIDGLTTNVGREGFDAERIKAVYRVLSETCDTLGDSLQIIVADSNIPDEAEQHVRIRLSEVDRLVRVNDEGV